MKENSKLLRLLKRMLSVHRVDGWSCSSDDVVHFVFYFCPRMKSSGFWIKQDGTGLETKYVPGISGFSAQRIARVVAFRKEMERSNADLPSITAIFASADSAMLFPQEVASPEKPAREEVGFPVIENLKAFREHRPVWETLRRTKPWLKNTPPHVQDAENRRLRGLLGPIPFPVADDFITRVFAGFAFDGVLLRREILGLNNPVILGVESPGVPVLQNAALDPDERIPVIQLK